MAAVDVVRCADGEVRDYDNDNNQFLYINPKEYH